MTKSNSFKEFVKKYSGVEHANDAAYQFARLVERCGGCTSGWEVYKSKPEVYDRSEYAADFMVRFGDKNDPLYWS